MRVLTRIELVFEVINKLEDAMLKYLLYEKRWYGFLSYNEIIYVKTFFFLTNYFKTHVLIVPYRNYSGEEKT